MICILYVNVVGFLLGSIGVLVDRLLPATMPRRWTWCATFLLSIALPGYYRHHHAFTVAGPSTAAPFVLDAGIASRIAAIDTAIERAWVIAMVLLGLWALVNAGWVSHVVRMSRAHQRHFAPRC